MSYTPGPWIGIEDEGVKTANGEHVFQTGCGCCTDSTLSEEDARLIAAAPELLAACQRLIDRIDAKGGWEIQQHAEVFNPWGDIVDQTRAAIEKAVGNA